MLLITGLTGKSGKWLLKRMESDRQYFETIGVRVIARTDSSVEKLRKARIKLEIVVGNTGDEVFIRRAMVNIDTVLHVAGIHTSRVIAKIAIESKVDWLILVHTTGIYSKYKAAGEEYRQTEKYISDLANGRETKITILRPTMIYGCSTDKNMIIFIKMVDRLLFFPVVSFGRFALQPIHEKDLGDAYYQVIKNSEKTKGKNYIVSGKDPIDLIDILKEISLALGKKNIFFSVPFPFAYLSASLIWLLTGGRIDYREKVKRLVEPRAFSHDEATKDFCFMPMTFKEGIGTEIEMYLKNK